MSRSLTADSSFDTLQHGQSFLFSEKHVSILSARDEQRNEHSLATTHIDAAAIAMHMLQLPCKDHDNLHYGTSPILVLAGHLWSQNACAPFIAVHEASLRPVTLVRPVARFALRAQ
eukprot:3100441-Pleurochrysis_carterae.AAC.1